MHLAYDAAGCVEVLGLNPSACYLPRHLAYLCICTYQPNISILSKRKLPANLPASCITIPCLDLTPTVYLTHLHTFQDTYLI